MANPRWIQTQRDLICFATKFTLQFHCIGKLLGGRVTVGNDLAELSGRQVPTSMLRSRE